MMKSEKVPFIHSETPKTIDASQEFPLFDDNDNEDYENDIDDYHIVDDGARDIENPLEPDDELRPHGTFYSSVINILNTILGAGLLTMSSAISTVGIVPGSLLICLTGFGSGMGLYLLSLCASKIGRKSSFFSVSQITFPGASRLIDLAIAVKCFGVATTYLIVVKQLLPEVGEGFTGIPAKDISDGFLLNPFICVSIAMVVAFPLALLKRLTALRHTSSLALLGIIYLFFLVLYFYFKEPVHPIEKAEPAKLFNYDSRSISSFSVFVFAFTCHQNLFPVYNEAINNSRPRMAIIITMCICISATLYLVMGNLGYLTFGSNITNNILNNYPPSIATTIGQFLYMLLTALSYPLQSHPCRASLEKLLPFTPEQRKKHPALIYYGLSMAIIGSSFVVAVYLNDLKKVLSVVGASGSTTICYLLPSLFYIRLHKGEGWTFPMIGAVFVGILGTLVMVICFPTSLYNIFRG